MISLSPKCMIISDHVFGLVVPSLIRNFLATALQSEAKIGEDYLAVPCYSFESKSLITRHSML